MPIYEISFGCCGALEFAEIEANNYDDALDQARKLSEQHALHNLEYSATEINITPEETDEE